MLTLITLITFMSAAIMLLFCALVIRRFLEIRGLHFLYWGIGLFMFSIASFAEAYLSLAWSRWAFFGWYFFGATLNAAWIGHGTMYLLFPRIRVAVWTALLLLGSMVALWLMLQMMPLLDQDSFIAGIPISKQYTSIMPQVDNGGTIRMVTPLFNIYGVITLVGGALWSSYLYYSRRILRNRMVGNLLIAAGVLLISFAGVLTRIGFGTWLYLGELLAAGLMFAGFLVTGRDTAMASTKISEGPPHSQYRQLSQ